MFLIEREMWIAFRVRRANKLFTLVLDVIVNEDVSVFGEDGVCLVFGQLAIRRWRES